MVGAQVWIANALCFYCIWLNGVQFMTNTDCREACIEIWTH